MKTVNPRYLSSASLDIFVLCLFYGLGRMGNTCFGWFWVRYCHNWQGFLFTIYNIIFSIDQTLYCKLAFIMFSECSFSVYQLVMNRNFGQSADLSVLVNARNRKLVNYFARLLDITRSNLTPVSLE